MTKEEIQDVIRKLNSNTMTSYEASYILPQALNALEEAHREIADLQTRLCNRMGCAHAVAFHLPGCPREQLATLGESTT